MWYLATGVVLIVFMLDFSTYYLPVTYIGPYIYRVCKIQKCSFCLSKMHYTVSVVMATDHHTTHPPSLQWWRGEI